MPDGGLEVSTSMPRHGPGRKKQPREQPSAAAQTAAAVAVRACSHLPSQQRKVSFCAGPLRRVCLGPATLDAADGHPCHEGETATRVYDRGNVWGSSVRISKKEVLVSDGWVAGWVGRL